MNNVQFDDQYQHTYSTRPKGLEGLMISWGLAKDKKGAQVVLLIVAVIAVIIAFGAPMIFSNNQNQVPQGQVENDPLPPVPGP